MRGGSGHAQGLDLGADCRLAVDIDGIPFQVRLVNLGLERAHGDSIDLPVLRDNIFANIFLATTEDDRGEEFPDFVHVADLRRELDEARAALWRSEIGVR